MNGRGGRQIGRSGPRIGLPVDSSRPVSGGQHRSVSRSVPQTGASYEPPQPQPQNSAPPPNHQQASLPLPPPLPGEERPLSSRSTGDRLSITQLFQHMEPQPRSYRTDAHEDAQKITHTSEDRVRQSPFATTAMLGGAALSILIVFVAGFLTAVLIFGEPDAGGEVAIRTGPSPSIERQVSVADTAPEVLPPASEGIVPSATADRAPLPAPSPEIAAAEDARNSALQNGNGNTGNVGGAPLPQSAPTPPVQESEIAPPSTPATISANEQPPVPPATVLNDRVFLPPVKPTEPDRTASADPAVGSGILAPPTGNYALQFGAFRDRANAEALVREIAAVAKGAIVEEVGATGTVLYYVRAGSFQTRAEALEAVRQLRRSTGIVTFVHANRGTG